MSSADLTFYNSTACATDGCGGIATHRFESGGVGSIYCPDCIGKIAAISTRPQPSPSSADKVSDAELKWARDIAIRVSVDVCEIERDSPEDDPMACIVYAPEISDIVESRIVEALEAAAATRRAQSAVEGDDRIEQAYKAGFDFAMLTRGEE